MARLIPSSSRRSRSRRAAGPGLYQERRGPLARDYSARAFTIGIGGPVGSGKTALLLALCRLLRDDYELAVVTNDIFTKEDAEFLVGNEALAVGAHRRRRNRRLSAHRGARRRRARTCRRSSG